MQTIAGVWDVDLKSIKINKENVKRDAQKYRMGSVRLALGRITTKEEFEDYKKCILNKPLP